MSEAREDIGYKPLPPKSVPAQSMRIRLLVGCGRGEVYEYRLDVAEKLISEGKAERE